MGAPVHCIRRALDLRESGRCGAEIIECSRGTVSGRVERNERNSPNDARRVATIAPPLKMLALYQTKLLTGRIPELEMIVTAHEAALTRERTLRAEAESERNAMLSSTFWRMTAPMRRAVNWLRRLRPGQLGFGS